MIKFFMLLAIVGAVLGGIQLLGTVQYADSAPQQAAGAALAVAYAVLPYCLARAVQGIVRDMGSQTTAEGPTGGEDTVANAPDALKERLRKKREEEERVRQTLA